VKYATVIVTIVKPVARRKDKITFLGLFGVLQ
jgi:hypothetical protein